LYKQKAATSTASVILSKTMTHLQHHYTTQRKKNSKLDQGNKTQLVYDNDTNEEAIKICILQAKSPAQGKQK